MLVLILINWSEWWLWLTGRLYEYVILGPEGLP